MLHIIRGAQGPAEDDRLRAMFAARKRIFVDLLGWAVPVVDGAYEIDQFDTESAIYVLLTDDTGRHLGSARLLPTSGPHILGELFTALCDGPCPRDPAIHEVTRFCLDRTLRARDRRIVRDTLVTALVDHALACGIRGYIAIAEVGWVRQIKAFGWRSRALGAPRAHGRAVLAALAIDIDRDTPRLLTGAGIVATTAMLATERREAA